jgi:hypothetical protein
MRLALALTMLGIASLHAQQPSGAPIVRAIEIRRGAVFDSALASRFWPYRVANSLHITTRRYVVRRELLFRAGEPYDSAKVHESERNLRALAIFRTVRIDTVSTDSGVIARVTTDDGWTTEPSFGLSSSGSQVTVTAFIAERNLLGTRTIASLGFVSDPDRRSVIVGFDTPRLIANRVGVGASYIDRTDGKAGSASIRYPFFSLSSPFGVSLFAQNVDTRVLRFVGGRSRAVDSLRRKFSILSTDGAIALRAGPRGYTRLGFTGHIRREDYGPEKGRLPVPRTVTGVAGPYLSFRQVRYIQTRYFQAMEQVEDIDLGLSFRATALAAPEAWGYDHSGIGTAFEVGLGQRLPLGFLLMGASVSGVHSSATGDSSSAIASGTLVMQGGTRHLLVANGVIGALHNPRPGGEFDLGLGYAVRAFPSHSFTGDREFLLNAEYRWLAMPSVMELVGIGIAGFVDHAGAWYAGSQRRTGTDAGIGLRIGSLRSAGSINGRLDLAYRWANDRQPAGWVFSLGRGFVFQRF